MIRLENRSRTVYQFDVPATENKPAHTLRLGDREDRDVPAAERDPRYTPSPVIEFVNRKAYDAIGPRNKAVLDALVKSGDVLRMGA